MVFFLFLLGLLLCSGVYLLAFDSPTLFYAATVLFHAGLGAALLLATLPMVAARWARWSGASRVAAGLLVLGGVAGGALCLSGNTAPYGWILQGHSFFSALGLLVLALSLSSRPRLRRTLLAALVLAALLPLSRYGWSYWRPDPRALISNPALVPTRMEEEGPGPASPFFPSAADTNRRGVIPSNLFTRPEACGRSGCHPDIYRQWKSSAHHFSSFNNPWYTRTVEYLEETAGPAPARWCGGCHDHALLFSGRMAGPIGPELKTPEAQAGLTCTSCHAITAVHSTMGNGHFQIDYPALHDLASSTDPWLERLHDLVVRLDPGPHKKVFMAPFMTRQPARYCSACHKVHLDKPVNGYRWIRGFNEYDGWQSSGVSGEGARSFYYPARPMKCVDCHMPLVPSRDAGNIGGRVHSHRFPGANTALPFLHGDTRQLRVVQDFLRDSEVRVDIFALARISGGVEGAVPTVPSHTPLQTASTFAEGDRLGFAAGRSAAATDLSRLLAPLDRVEPVVRPGETVRVDVVVRTLNVGHFFPGGTVDASDVWVELKVEDEGGHLVFWSGYLPRDAAGRRGPVDPGAHFYRSFLLDAHGHHINKRNAWAARSVLYVRLIPPGAADTVHFRLHIPEEASGSLRLEARVLHRKFSWWTNQWVFAGVRDPSDPSPAVDVGYDDGRWVFRNDVRDIPDLPVTVLAQARARLRVDPQGKNQQAVLEKGDRMRWNDYGIGLLLQGDLKGAGEVFERLTRIDPEYVDGWVNTGRARLAEGRLEEARRVLEKALEIRPNLARAHYFLALVFKGRGRYHEALRHLRKVERQYPRDRVVLNQMGRILFLQRHFRQAVGLLRRVLAIDTEDLEAHYNLMLAYRGLGERRAAAREQALYLRYKADESAQSITGPYRRRHPLDNNERQAIHEHGSFPLEKIARPRRARGGTGE